MAKTLAHDGYKPGDVILEAPVPYVQMICSQYRGKICNFCFKESESLKKCTGCGWMFYCDKKCQKSDWAAETRPGHKHECPVLKVLSFVDSVVDQGMLTSLSDMFFAAVRMIANHRVKPSLRKVTVNVLGIDRCYDDLISRLEEIKSDPQMSQSMGRLQPLYKQIFDSDVSLDEICEANGAFLENSLHITDPITKVKLGRAVYLESSIFNLHSSNPNATPVFLGNKLQILAIKSIPPSQPLHIP